MNPNLKKSMNSFKKNHYNVIKESTALYWTHVIDFLESEGLNYENRIKEDGTVYIFCDGGATFKITTNTNTRYSQCIGFYIIIDDEDGEQEEKHFKASAEDVIKFLQEFC